MKTGEMIESPLSNARAREKVTSSNGQLDGRGNAGRWVRERGIWSKVVGIDDDRERWKNKVSASEDAVVAAICHFHMGRDQVGAGLRELPRASRSIFEVDVSQPIGSA